MCPPSGDIPYLLLIFGKFVTPIINGYIGPPMRRHHNAGYKQIYFKTQVAD
jgi:hypothetical protein